MEAIILYYKCNAMVRNYRIQGEILESGKLTTNQGRTMADDMTLSKPVIRKLNTHDRHSHKPALERCVKEANSTITDAYIL